MAMKTIDRKDLEQITGGLGALFRAVRGEPLFPNWAANRMGRFQARAGGGNAGGCASGNCAGQ